MQGTQRCRPRVQAKHVLGVFGLGAVVAAGVTVATLTPADSGRVDPAGHTVVADPPTTSTTPTTSMSMYPGMHMPGM